MRHQGDVIVVPTGRRKGIWCRTQAAYDTIANAMKHLPIAEERSGAPTPALIAGFRGTVVAVAPPDVWQELQAKVDARGRAGRAALSTSPEEPGQDGGRPS